ncbi:mycofactocin system transcriptional regulator [Microbacterium sp. B2969]|uniref:Mycofactocin system transcriptional regulator n=1 Tax=Microbacterium alkaliflavum TaxID=3248839 RepID=A0ABW7Q3D8_9MICO
MALSAEWKASGSAIVLVVDLSAQGEPVAGPRRPGRAPVTTHGELSRIALELFLAKGFDETTMDDVALAAGIGRRTLFRYFPSKNDLPWGDFDALIAAMRVRLAASPPDQSLIEAIVGAIIDFNRFPAHEVPLHRERMRLLLHVPSLAAHSTLRYAAWRQAIADYAAARLGTQASALEPQAIAWACLGLCVAGYEHWLTDDDLDLLTVLETAFAQSRAVFGDSAP